ncbi:MAG TPA: sensor histidine kinase [Planosporangium sp.]|jgi:signal transduction histidine kinase|nr:sensor histidine kinase [Planosporangium sp.]
MTEGGGNSTGVAAPRWRAARSHLRRRAVTVRSALRGSRPDGDETAAGEPAFPRLRQLTTPALLALTVLLASTGTGVLNTHYAHPPLPLLLATAQAAPLLICRRSPVTASIVTVAASLGAALLALPLDPRQPWPWTPVALIAFLCVQFALSASRPWWIALAGWGLAVGGTMLVVDVSPVPASNGNDTMIVLLPATVTLGGQILWVRRQARSRIMRHERLSAEERAGRQLLEERARIARELHDVVAHHMSVIAVQASSAEYRIDGLSPAVRSEFESISTSARDSLAEMRRLLAVLRGHDAGSERSPQPGLDRLDEVVDTARRAGLEVTLAVRDLPAGLPDALGLSVFRIVQEALSNVIRHAPATAVRVEVVAGSAQLVIRVDNEPPPGPGHRVVESTGTGHGLVGMRERVAMLGGELVAHPRADGGFTVRAVLPLP